MIIGNVNEVLNNTVGGESTEFNIVANAKAFKILSSNLYENCVDAIVQELVSNAVDSHIAAGKVDVPIEITCPNTIQPFFQVKDFGLGLSHDDVMSIYTTYFKSTKTNTNDLIGGYGLGSKSPFSYTTAFNFQSVYDGKKRDYLCFIGDKGIPNVNLLSTIDTDESNGLTVTVPVSDCYDFDVFYTAVFKKLRFMQGKFAIKNDRDNLKKFNEFRDTVLVDLNKNGFAIHYDQHNNGRNVTFVIGGVPYAVRVSNHFKYLKSLKDSISINVPIGYLDLTAGRDRISYDSETTRRVNEILEKYNNQLGDDFNRMFEDENILVVDKIKKLSVVYNTLMYYGLFTEFKTKLQFSATLRIAPPENGKVSYVKNFQISYNQQYSTNSTRFNDLLQYVVKYKDLKIYYCVYSGDPKRVNTAALQNSAFFRSKLSGNYLLIVANESNLLICNAIFGVGVDTFLYGDIKKFNREAIKKVASEQKPKTKTNTTKTQIKLTNGAIVDLKNVDKKKTWFISEADEKSIIDFSYIFTALIFCNMDVQYISKVYKKRVLSAGFNYIGESSLPIEVMKVHFSKKINVHSNAVFRLKISEWARKNGIRSSTINAGHYISHLTLNPKFTKSDVDNNIKDILLDADYLNWLIDYCLIDSDKLKEVETIIDDEFADKRNCAILEMIDGVSNKQMGLLKVIVGTA